MRVLPSCHAHRNTGRKRKRRRRSTSRPAAGSATDGSAKANTARSRAGTSKSKAKAEKPKSSSRTTRSVDAKYAADRSLGNVEDILGINDDVGEAFEYTGRTTGKSAKNAKLNLRSELEIFIKGLQIPSTSRSSAPKKSQSAKANAAGSSQRPKRELKEAGAAGPEDSGDDDSDSIAGPEIDWEAGGPDPDQGSAVKETPAPVQDTPTPAQLKQAERNRKARERRKMRRQKAMASANSNMQSIDGLLATLDSDGDGEVGGVSGDNGAEVAGVSRTAGVGKGQQAGAATQSRSQRRKQGKKDVLPVLYVGNLPFEAKQSDIWSFLKLKESDQDWTRVVEILKGKHKGLGRGFAFLQVKTRSAYDRSLSRNNQKFKNRIINVEPVARDFKNKRAHLAANQKAARAAAKTAKQRSRAQTTKEQAKGSSGNQKGKKVGAQATSQRQQRQQRHGQDKKARRVNVVPDSAPTTAEDSTNGPSKRRRKRKRSSKQQSDEPPTGKISSRAQKAATPRADVSEVVPAASQPSQPKKKRRRKRNGTSGGAQPHMAGESKAPATARAPIAREMSAETSNQGTSQSNGVADGTKKRRRRRRRGTKSSA